jgi:predicted nucleic acid-binding protein
MKYQVCVDASLALKWFLPIQQDPLADSLLDRWDQAGTELVGPPLFNTEVTSIIRLNVYNKRLLPQQGETAFQSFRELNVKIISPSILSLVAWELAKKHNQPRTYDMQYLALAELVDCDLWTADLKLVNSLQGKNKRVRWIGEKMPGTRA